MPKECAICGKGPIPGNKYVRRGAAKLHGGAGQKITGKTLRRFLPNLQRVKARLNGAVKTILVCTRCIKKGLVVKA